MNIENLNLDEIPELHLFEYSEGVDKQNIQGLLLIKNGIISKTFNGIGQSKLEESYIRQYFSPEAKKYLNENSFRLSKINEIEMYANTPSKDQFIALMPFEPKYRKELSDYLNNTTF